MTRHRFRSVLAILLLAVATASPANAAGIVAGSTILPGTAIQDITLLPNTPFNPTSSPILISGVSGVGSITINRDAQAGSVINIPTLAGGMFFGSNPNLGSYVFGNISPLTGADFSGVINNVVQNIADPGFATGQPSSFQSGDFSFGGNSFGFEFLTGPAAGVTLFTDPAVPFSFSSTFDGLPPSAGTVLANSGPDALNILFNGEVVAQSSDRRIILASVPEPSTIVLLAAGGLSLFCYRLRSGRRKARLRGREPEDGGTRFKANSFAQPGGIGPRRRLRGLVGSRTTRTSVPGACTAMTPSNWCFHRAARGRRFPVFHFGGSARAR